MLYLNKQEIHFNFFTIIRKEKTREKRYLNTNYKTIN